MTMTNRTLLLLLFITVAALTGCASPGPDPEEAAKEIYSRETLLSVAERAVQENNPERALAIYQQLLTRDGKDRQLLTAAAALSYDLREFDLSASYYERRNKDHKFPRHRRYKNSWDKTAPEAW